MLKKSYNLKVKHRKRSIIDELIVLPTEARCLLTSQTHTENNVCVCW